MIKAIFFDIDGTLVSFKTHKVPESALRAINNIRKKGIKVFIATGRHIMSIPDFGELQFDGFITINGGLCLKADKTPVYKHPIAKSNVEAMIELQKTNPFSCLVMDDSGLYINFTNQDVEVAQELKLFPGLKIRPFSESLKVDIYQMVSFISVEKEQNIMSLVPECDSLRWHPLFTDIVPKGSNKANGIDKIISYLGIELDETMAFGDGGNDIAMLKHAGIGVVMGNADDKVKEIADYVTDSVDEDGILKALQHFNLI